MVIIQLYNCLLDSKLDHLGETVGIKDGHIGKNLAVKICFTKTSNGMGGLITIAWATSVGRSQPA